MSEKKETKRSVTNRSGREGCEGFFLGGKSIFRHGYSYAKGLVMRGKDLLQGEKGDGLGPPAEREELGLIEGLHRNARKGAADRVHVTVEGHSPGEKKTPHTKEKVGKLL